MDIFKNIVTNDLRLYPLDIKL